MLHRSRFTSHLVSVRSARAMVAAVAGAVLLAACTDESTLPIAPSSVSTSNSAATGDYLIIGNSGQLPADLDARVSAAGGSVVKRWPQIGVALVTSPGGSFGANVAGIPGVTTARDVVLEYVLPGRVSKLDASSAPAVSAQVASIADNEPFYRYQWGPASIQAPEVWNMGITGAGVRVAIVDGGLWNVHPDLAAGIDVAASRSFVPGAAFNTDTDPLWHGTYVAGIVGARDNGTGVIGIAPGATLIGVKILHGGSGNLGWLIDALIYAATPIAQGGAGAQVINMSLGILIDEKDQEIKADVREFAKIIDRVARYATMQGALLIAATGNDGISLDANKTLLDIPAMSASVLGVTATGPLGWAYGATNFSRIASYSTYGKAIVDLAAPGGDFAYPGNENCTVAGFRTACWVFDMYLSTSFGGYSWAAGTSTAAPVAAGVAALVIQANGGSMTPAQVAAKLRQGAIDLGKPGFDEFYGHGFVNALNSVTK